jgi:large subunit ribosomal protein L5e
MEEIYINAHAAIREDPTFKPTDKSTDWKSESVKHKAKRLTHKQRQDNIAAKIEKFKASGGVKVDDEEDD